MLRALTSLLFLSLICGCSSESRSDSHLQFCELDLLGSETIEQCECKLDVLEEHYGRDTIQNLYTALENDDDLSFQNQMIALAVNSPEKAEDASRLQATKCKMKTD